ncbi:MAG: TolC family protein [Clostridiales Family XIII bacterium]|nr:TolC family protein [Clostridiales Family XIII bacterium]
MRKLIAGVLALVAVTSYPAFTDDVADVSAAALTPFTLTQAESMALSASPEIKKVYSQILLKKINYTDSVTATQVKLKDKQTLRWTPLLSFKFPEKLNMTDEMEMNVKPLSLTSEIVTLQHQMNDERYAVLAKVRKAYFDTYILHERSNYTQQMLTGAQENLARNKSRLLVGRANQSDVDTIQSSVTKLNSDLSQQLREYQSAKSNLSDIVKLNVTTGYRFLNPLRDADFSRDQLLGVVNHTLNEDQGVYAARAAETLALLTLNTTERLMRSKYGGNMDRLNSFISLARQGGDVDYAAFQIQYRQMLTAVDSRWAGSIRIIFFRFSREFLKGQIDGTRYIEDEPYALYTACMEYASARSDRIQAESDLRKQVNTDYEALVTARNASNGLADSVAEAKTSLDRLLTLNRIGKAEFSEVQGQLDDYQSLQLDALDALSAYNDLLTSFDRLTCGAVSMYFTGKNFAADVGGGALSYPTEDGQIWYYLYNDVADLTFVFGLDVPDDFSPEVTEYELWYETVNLSGRVEASELFRHLTLDYGDTSRLIVKLFGDDGYVGECEIDTTIPRAPLPLANEANAPPVAAEQTIGSYRVETKIVGTVGASMLTPEFDARVKARYYKLQYGGDDVVNSDLVPVGEGFNYLSLLVKDLSNVDIFVFDSNETQICKASFNVVDETIRTTDKLPDGGN